MEVHNYRTPRWPSYQGKRKRYQGRPHPQAHPMEIERSYSNFRGRNSLNEQRQPPWDHKKNSRTFPTGKRRRKEFMQDEHVNKECMQDEYMNQKYGHYKKRQRGPRYEEEKVSIPCDPDLVMAEQTEKRAQVLSNERNLKVYESILPHLGMRRYEESEGSDAKSSVSFLTWCGDCESMDIDSQYIDARFIADLNDIQNKMVFLDVKKDDICLQCSDSFGSLFL